MSKKRKATAPAPQSPSYGLGSRYCHDGPVCVGRIGKAHVYAGDWLEALPVRQWDLVISAMSTVSASHFEAPVTGNSMAKRLLPEMLFRTRPVAHVTLDWPDGGTPPLASEWWAELVTAIATIDGKVMVHCQGGHGRTGTALAILFTLAGQVPKRQCPVGWLRKRYCVEAVENDEQADYIEAITNRRVRSEPSWCFGAAPVSGTGPTPEETHGEA